MLRKVASWGATIAVVWVAAGLLQLFSRQVLFLLVGWTLTGLVACAFVAIGRLRRDLDAAEQRSKDGLTVCGRSIDNLYAGRARHAEALDKLLRVSSSNASRLDAHSFQISEEKERRAKMVRVLKSHQTTLEVMGLALGVKNPKPFEEKGAPS